MNTAWRCHNPKKHEDTKDTKFHEEFEEKKRASRVENSSQEDEQGIYPRVGGEGVGNIVDFGRIWPIGLVGRSALTPARTVRPVEAGDS
jgi:hypothetical protein